MGPRPITNLLSPNLSETRAKSPGFLVLNKRKQLVALLLTVLGDSMNYV